MEEAYLRHSVNSERRKLPKIVPLVLVAILTFLIILVSIFNRHHLISSLNHGLSFISSTSNCISHINTNTYNLKETYIVTKSNLNHFQANQNDIIRANTIIRFEDTSLIEFKEPLILDKDITIVFGSTNPLINKTAIACPKFDEPLFQIT